MQNILSTESYPTDVEKVPTVVTAPAREIRLGDVVDGRIVGEIKKGTKRVTAWDTDGKEMLYVMLDDEVTYSTLRATDEAVERSIRNRRNRTLVFQIQQAEQNVQAALDAISKRISDGSIAGYSDIEDLMTSQANLRVFHTLKETALSTTDEDADLVAVAERLAESYSRKIVASLSYSLSRSTNQVSNLIEDAETQAMAKFAEQVLRGW